jgi:hypothetical protein
MRGRLDKASPTLDSADRSFKALVSAAARDPLTCGYFAVILTAQGLPADEFAAIWRSFLDFEGSGPVTAETAPEESEPSAVRNEC